MDGNTNMTVKSYKRGWLIISRGDKWIYADTGKSAEIERPCVRCGKMPTPEGHDACLGIIPGVVFACCGHGVEKSYVVYKNKYKNKNSLLPWYIKTGRSYMKNNEYIVEMKVNRLAFPYILLTKCGFHPLSLMKCCLLHPLRVIRFLIT